MKGKSEIIDFYNGFSERQGINLRHHSMLSKLIEAGLKKTDRVLEIGCGTGSLTILMAEYLRKGTIKAIDISPESIRKAEKLLALYKNIVLTDADVTDYNFGNDTFHAIVLPDVLEHIPTNFHNKLFSCLSKLLKPQGFVFIHIPNPEYLAWCREHKPEVLQIIDNPIHTNDLVKNIYPHGFYIHELKTYPIWVRDGDYQYLVLRKTQTQDFTIEIKEKTTFLRKLKSRIYGG